MASSSYNLLNNAIIKCNLKEVKELLSAGTQVNEIDEYGNCALNLALSKGNIEIVNELLHAGALVHVTNNLRKSSLDQVNIDKNEFEDLLKEYIIGVRVVKRQYIQELPEKMMELIYSSLEEDCCEKYNYTPLHNAVDRNDLRRVENLIKRGAKTNPHLYALTPFHLIKTAECAELLLKSGAKPIILDRFNLRNSNHFLLLISNIGCKCIKEKYRIIKVLGDHGLNFDALPKNDLAQFLFNNSNKKIIEGFKDIFKYTVAKHNYREKHYLSLFKKPELKKFTDFWKACLDEIKQLKAEKIAYNLTFLDLVTKNTKQLSRYVRNENLQLFENDEEVKKKFPIYHIFLLNSFNDAKKLRQYWENASLSLNILMPAFTAQGVVKDYLLDFLTIQDIENLSIMHEDTI